MNSILREHSLAMRLLSTLSGLSLLIPMASLRVFSIYSDIIPGKNRSATSYGRKYPLGNIYDGVTLPNPIPTLTLTHTI